MSNFTYKGVKATWHYLKHCYEYVINGHLYSSLADEVKTDIDEILGQEQ